VLWRETPRSFRRMFWGFLILALAMFIGLAWLFLATFGPSN
jgi:hypothetical protein